MKRLRILIADDESIIRLDLREILTDMGHEVVAEVSTGEDAVSQACTLSPDLILLDLKMPGMGGLEALKQINESAVTPVIVLTAFSDKDLVEQAADLGAAAYIVKPFQASSLLPAIHLAITRSAELQSLRSENESLKETISASKLVNIAKGLLSEHEGLSERDAFRKIQKMSMDRNKKMSEVAEAIILVYSGR